MNRTNFSYQQLDEIIHSRIRLAIMALLATVESATFSYIKKEIGTSDGNLSIHLRKLEIAGYVEITKTFVRRKPETRCRLTAKGQKAFQHYLETLEGLLKQKR